MGNRAAPGQPNPADGDIYANWRTVNAVCDPAANQYAVIRDQHVEQPARADAAPVHPTDTDSADGHSDLHTDGDACANPDALPDRTATPADQHTAARTDEYADSITVGYTRADQPARADRHADSNGYACCANRCPAADGCAAASADGYADAVGRLVASRR